MYPEITDIQFRAMARERGYELRKREKRTTLLNCPICDKKYTRFWINTKNNTCFRVCVNCGFEGYETKTIEGSKKSWNEAVKDCLQSKGKNIIDGGNEKC